METSQGTRDANATSIAHPSHLTGAKARSSGDNDAWSKRRLHAASFECTSASGQSRRRPWIEECLMLNEQ